MTRIIPESILTVFLVEDHDDFRHSMQFLLDSHDMIHCQAFESVEEVMDAIENNIPSVIIMDINLPGKSGIEGTRLIKENYPAIQIMMCTVYEDETKIFEALKAGASGYILKRAAFDDIYNAVLDVATGGSPMSPKIARKVVASFQSAPNADFGLSIREQEVLDLLAEGLLIKQVADKLFVSVNTIRKHIQHIYEKLQVQSRIEAINKAASKRFPL